MDNQNSSTNQDQPRVDVCDSYALIYSVHSSLASPVLTSPSVYFFSFHTYPINLTFLVHLDEKNYLIWKEEL